MTAETQNVDWVAKAQGLKLEVRNLIDGRCGEIGGAPLDKWSPRDGTLLCRLGCGEVSQADAAVASARRAFVDGRWSKLPVQRRKDVLYKLATLIEQHRDELALLECLDVGKPITEVLSFDVPAAAGIFKFNAEAADKAFGRVYAADQSNLSYQLRRPLGVVAGIVGWNFPLVLEAMKSAPALATGNSLVLKPSELTSFSASRLAELALEAGVPEGVFNVVHGDGAIGAALARHPGVDLIAFTGSTQTGKKLLIASGESNMKRLVLECGGKAPNIVFDDAPDLEAVAAGVVARAFWNQGQVCTASARLLVQETVWNALLPLIVRKTAALRLGDPLCATTAFGALVSRGHRQKVIAYIDRGDHEGATRLYTSDSKAPYPDGFYVAPVIFGEVSSKQRIVREEIFGPVLSVMTFRDEEEAIRLANETTYGLSAIVWTRDLGRAHRVAMGIQAGWITVNATGTPVGGPGEGMLPVGGHKESGIGLEGGIEGLEAYTSQTAVQCFV
jgi:acyl-CoA reductase-like NAD-dependent aldehyde dehydrogenase